MRARLPKRIILSLTVIAVLGLAWRWLRPVEDSSQPSAASNAVSTSKPIASQSSDSSPSAQQVNGNANTHAVATENTLQSSSAHPLDPVLGLARKALGHIEENVDDYTGKLIKRERVKGTLGGEVQLEFKIQTKRQASEGRAARPLSAYLKFTEPWSARGREVIWVEGRNDNKLFAHEGGFKNLMRVQLEPTSMLAMLDNKYPITEIGLTKLVEKLIEKGERDREVGPCEVQIIEGQTVGDRTCQLIQVTHPEPNAKFDFHIAQIFIDTERMIPLRYAAFMWPKKAGEEPPLEEEYTYLDVKLNVGLTDADFDPENPDYKFPK